MSRPSSIPVRALFWALAIGFPASLLGVFFWICYVMTFSEVFACMAAVLWLPFALVHFTSPPSFHIQFRLLEAKVLFSLLQFPYYYFLAILVLRFRSWRSGRPFPLGQCQKCGYNLRGNVSGSCSECGTDIQFDYHDLRAAQLRKGRRWLRVVLVIALIAASFWVNRSESIQLIVMWDLAVVIVVLTVVRRLMR